MPLSYLELTLRLALSIILGGVIGLERETINKPAGFRTHNTGVSRLYYNNAGFSFYFQ